MDIHQTLTSVFDMVYQVIIVSKRYMTNSIGTHVTDGIYFCNIKEKIWSILNI
jgi:hypothetical protein